MATRNSNVYSFPDLTEALALLRVHGQNLVVDERALLDERVKTLTMGARELANVDGDGNCMVHAFCRTAQIDDNVITAQGNAANWLKHNRDVMVKVCYI